MTSAVTIIGAGWAGLAAAVSLSSRNIPVHVYESARQPGGRARSVNLADMEVDNGQHLMIGAYGEMLRLLQLIGAEEKDLFIRLPQHLKTLHYPGGATAFDLRLPKLPAPLHLLFGMLCCSSLNWEQKITTLVRFDRLLKRPIENDICVGDWLAGAKLPQNYVENCLEPLCLAALTTHTHQASARTFQNVLAQTFSGPRANTDLLIAKRNLGQVFPELASEYITSKGPCCPFVRFR
jgi:predicted NAD/FAD-binding protein